MTLTQKIDCPDLPRGWPRTESQIDISPSVPGHIKHITTSWQNVPMPPSSHTNGPPSGRHTSQLVDKKHPVSLCVYNILPSRQHCPHNQLAKCPMILCLCKCPQHQHKPKHFVPKREQAATPADYLVLELPKEIFHFQGKRQPVANAE